MHFMNLKPCPFCGSKEVVLDEAARPTLDEWSCEWQIVCQCGARGPLAKDNRFEVASKLWNKRVGGTESFMRERIELSMKGSLGDSWKPMLKIGEEFGELCEAVLIDLGSLAYKEKKVSTIDEVADILNAVAAFLARHYGRSFTTDEILEMLDAACRRKLDKYLKEVLNHKEST